MSSGFGSIGRRAIGMIGGSHDHPAAPGDRKEHAAVIGLGNHQGRLAWQERLVENDVRSLAWRYQDRRSGVVHVADVVGEHAGGVDDSPRRDRAFLASLLVSCQDALDAPFVLVQSGYGKVIERTPSKINQRARQGDGQPRVVELAIGVDNPAAQADTANCGHASDDVRRARPSASGPD